MRILTTIFLVLTVTCYPTPLIASVAAQSPPNQEVQKLLDRDYVSLFERAPDARISEAVLENYREYLENQKDQEEEELENQKERIENRIDQAQSDLEDLNQDTAESATTEERRHTLHCTIQQSRKELREVELALEKGLDLKYDNKFAKLKTLSEWPEEYAKAQQQLEAGEAVDRKFGDFRDVGFRSGPFEGQQEDIERGREAIEQLEQRDMLPPEVQDEEITAYIDKLSARIARHSDLQVPLKVTLLKSQEINAFALPGGFLFINSGLVEKAEDESELAGVIAHEIAHVAARHGDRLMGKANIANIIFQAAQLAALIFSGGISSLASYYLLQYGFYGLGLVLNLSLLGVSRDYEIEADILGTQYLWHSNYDTRGFVDFFGRMAQEEGYVTGLSWFRTHPPFYERMERTFQEIIYLPEQEEPIVDSEQFQNVKDRLAGILEEMEEQDREAPTLRRVYDCENGGDQQMSSSTSSGGC